MVTRAIVVVLCVCLGLTGLNEAATMQRDADNMHSYPARKSRSARNTRYSEEENEANFWNTAAQQTIYDKITSTYNMNTAKNVILFLGDGMSIPTLTATRAYIGQKRNESGEEASLSFDQFPFTALSKTYCVDSQVADSACSATAYLCGVKTNEGTLGVNGKVALGDCAASTDQNNHVYSIAKWFQNAGKRSGLVTTTRITHASPGGVYAHIAHRDWESDTDAISYGDNNITACPDIAYQLVYGETGKNLNVALGGGRGKFLPKGYTDEEGTQGERTDGENLVQRWLNSKGDAKAQYVWNKKQLLNVSADTEYLLGLFDKSHCQYHLDANPETEPTLAEMTEAAIKVLSRDDAGYFLFVEGGRIDHAHHDTLAWKALDETEQFSIAIQKAVDITSRSDTLIVVTSDHAHTMSMSGYPKRGNKILGVGGTGDDNLPYATLSYANGPGYSKHVEPTGGRKRLIESEMLSDTSYMYPAMVPIISETHGGDDVAIFALGPQSSLFTGVLEQNVIAHLMAYASCVGDGHSICEDKSSSGSSVAASLGAILALLAFFVIRQ